ncbi:MAG: hypothetical protein WCR72_14135 [Bacteroidota bacterium]
MDEEKEAGLRAASIGTTTTKIIGLAGGVIKSENGKISLDFPAGALIKNTEISIVEAKNEAPNGCGNSFNLLPDGLTFTKPAKLTLKFTENEINGASAEALRVLTQISDSIYEVDMNTSLDIYNKTISSNINHFSKWGFASINRLNLVPDVPKIVKGQTVLFRISQWYVSPSKKDTKEGKMRIASTIKKLYEIKTLRSEYENDVKNNAIIEDQPGFYKVTKWNLDGDNPDKTLLGTLKVVNEELTRANYTAPMNISSGWLTRKVRISVDLEENREYEYAPLINKASLKLSRRIEIIENGEVNYTVRGETVKSLELVNSEFVKLLKEKGSDEVASHTNVATCFINKGEMTIGCSGAFLTETSPIGIFLVIPHPKLGENLLTCHKDYNSQGSKTDVQVFKSGTDFTATIVETVRKRVKGECVKNDVCHDLWVKITQLDQKIGGMVCGEFFGAVYEDGEKEEDACINSKKFVFSGDFSLVISNISK